MGRFHTNEWDLLPERAFRPRAGRHIMTLEGGGKGSSAPTPDPRLVEAQMKSMGIQDQAIQGIMKNTEAMLPLQKEQMQFGLDSAKTAYQQSQSDREWMLSRRNLLSGVQDKIAGEAAAFDEEQRGKELSGEAMADVNRGFSAARGQSARSMAALGVNSGRSKGMDVQLQIAQAGALAGGANQARRAAKSEGIALQDRANNALAGYPAMSSQATGAGAGYAANGINLVNAGLGGMNSGFGSAASVAGQMGTNATGMWGAQGNYKNAQDQINQGESLGSLLGGLGGAATGLAKIWPSDRRLKTDIELVGADPATGLNIYRFAYLADPARRFIGVMADEVRRLVPGAVARGADDFDSVDYGLLGLEMVEV